jgi:hypothetical protein
MAKVRTTLSSNMPWSVRLFDAAPVPPAIVGILIAITVFTLYVVKDLYLSPFAELRNAPGPAWTVSQFWLELLQAIWIGYLPAATAYSVRAAERSVRDLRSTLDVSETDFAKRFLDIAGSDSKLMQIIGIGAIGVGLWIPFMDGFWNTGRPPIGHPDLTWHMIRLPLISWLVSRTVLVEILIAQRFSVLGRSALVDLLDLSPLSPFTRRGLHSVLLLMLFTALFSLMLLTNIEMALNSAMLVFIPCTAITALVLPVMGVHRRIAEVKRTELAQLRDAIRRRRKTLLEAKVLGSTSNVSLTDLLAYETRITSVATWPFDLSTLMRFGFYLVIGAGSWLGSAFVERMLTAALD